MSRHGVDPRYLSHFTDPLYGSRVLDAAPFGSDQGADMLHDVESAGDVLPAGATIESLLPWGDVDGHFDVAATGDVDGLLLIYAAGFLLLRYTGHIDDSDYDILRRALMRIASVIGLDDVTGIVIPDLDTFVRRSTS